MSHGSEFSVSATQSDGVTVAVLTGEIDLASCTRLGQQLTEIVATGDRVELDMSNVAFMDSTGLRVLVAAKEDSRRRGGSLVVTAASEPVRRLLEITGLAGEFSLTTIR